MTTVASLIADPTAGSPPRRSRWVPVSLKLFLAILLLLGVGSALWIGIPAYRQYVAIREIKRVGGQISFDRSGPDWLRELVGDDFMHCIDDVEHVHFRPDKTNYDRDPRGLYGGSELPYTNGPTIDDSTLGCIVKIPHVKSLCLRWANVTDAGMKHISQLRDLRHLRLEGTQVSDASGKLFSQLSSLESLDVRKSKLTEAGLMHLKTLTKFEHLDLDCTQITTASVPWLSEMPNLKSIFIDEVDFDRRSRVPNDLRRALPGVAIY